MPTDPSDNMDEEKYHPNSSSRSRRQLQHLPSIREMFGDVLEQPARPRRVSNSREMDTSRRRLDPSGTEALYANYNFHDQQSHSLEQPQFTRSRSSSALPGSSRATSPVAGHYERSNTYPPRRSSRQYENHAQYQDSKPIPPDRFSPSHSFDMFTMGSDEGLVHQRSSTSDNFQQKSKEEAISQSTGKHLCPECGRRFEKRSHFKNHMTSHTGEKPFVCPWPECGKAFGSSSNMRRHQRGHLLEHNIG